MGYIQDTIKIKNMTVQSSHEDLKSSIEAVLKEEYNRAINDAIAAIDRLWDESEDFASSLHIKIENELDKLKVSLH